MSTNPTEIADRSKAADKDVDMTAVAANEQAGKKQKDKKPPKEKKPQGQGKQGQAQGKKKEGGGQDQDTKGITTKKEDDLAAWYQEVLLKGEFLEYSDIPGCYILNVSKQHPTSRPFTSPLIHCTSLRRTQYGNPSKPFSTRAFAPSAYETATSPSSSPKPTSNAKRITSRASRPRSRGSPTAARRNSRPASLSARPQKLPCTRTTPRRYAHTAIYR